MLSNRDILPLLLPHFLPKLKLLHQLWWLQLNSKILDANQRLKSKNAPSIKTSMTMTQKRPPWKLSVSWIITANWPAASRPETLCSKTISPSACQMLTTNQAHSHSRSVVQVHLMCFRWLLLLKIKISQAVCTHSKSAILKVVTCNRRLMINWTLVKFTVLKVYKWKGLDIKSIKEACALPIQRIQFNLWMKKASVAKENQRMKKCGK